MVGSAPAAGRALRKANVLVVDDKPANQLALAAVLEEGYNLLFAVSGEAALEILRKRSDVDVVLMDVQMPGMDGFIAAAHIKRMKGYEDVPIIFVTAVYNEDPHVRRGYEVGGIDYFAKPFDPEILKMKLAVYASFRMKADFLRQREEHIRASEELLRVGRKLSAILETLPVGVLIADTEGRICQSTEEATRILGSVEAAASDSYGEILGWWDASGRLMKGLDGPLARALHRGEASHSEPVEILGVDGAAKTVLMSASPLHRLDGEIAGAVVLIQDLTETKQIEEALENRVAKLIGLGVELEEVAGKG